MTPCCSAPLFLLPCLQILTPAQLQLLRQQIDTLRRLNVQLRALKYRARTGHEPPFRSELAALALGSSKRSGGGRGHGRGRGSGSEIDGLVIGGGRGRGRGRGRGGKRGRFAWAAQGLQRLGSGGLDSCPCCGAVRFLLRASVSDDMCPLAGPASCFAPWVPAAVRAPHPLLCLLPVLPTAREDEEEDNDSIVVGSSEEEEEEAAAAGSSDSDSEEEEEGSLQSADSEESEEDFTLPTVTEPRRTGRARRPSKLAKERDESSSSSSSDDGGVGQAPAKQEEQQQQAPAPAGPEAAEQGEQRAPEQGSGSAAGQPRPGRASSGGAEAEGGPSGGGPKRKALFMVVSEEAADAAGAPLQLPQLKAVVPPRRKKTAQVEEGDEGSEADAGEQPGEEEEEVVCSVCGDAEAPEDNVILLCEGKGCRQGDRGRVGAAAAGSMGGACAQPAPRAVWSSNVRH